MPGMTTCSEPSTLATTTCAQAPLPVSASGSGLPARLQPLRPRARCESARRRTHGSWYVPRQDGGQRVASCGSSSEDSLPRPRAPQTRRTGAGDSHTVSPDKQHDTMEYLV